MTLNHNAPTDWRIADLDDAQLIEMADSAVARELAHRLEIAHGVNATRVEFEPLEVEGLDDALADLARLKRFLEGL